MNKHLFHYGIQSMNMLIYYRIFTFFMSFHHLTIFGKKKPANFSAVWKGEIGVRTNEELSRVISDQPAHSANAGLIVAGSSMENPTDHELCTTPDKEIQMLSTKIIGLQHYF